LIVQAVSVAAIAVASVVLAHTRGGRLEGALAGMYGNPNDLALAIDLCLPLCLALALTSRSPVKKIAWMAAMLAMIYTVLLTASRAGALALAVVVLICLWQFGVKSGRAYLLLFVPLAVIAIGLHSSQSLRERFTQTSVDSSNPGQTTSASASAQQRKELLLQSLKVTAEHPLFGVGPGNFAIVSGVWHVSHNSYTQISAEGGVPAFILYLLVLWRAVDNLRCLRKYPKIGKGTRVFSIALWASLAAYLVGSFFASVAYLLFPYCLVAYTSALVQIARRERIASRQATESIPVGTQIEATV
jgi:putative inorganic carbon (hco3(-)) transporter